MFKNNVGMVDRVIRLVIGVAALGAFFLFPDAPWRMWTLLGLVPLATGALGTCPLYSIFGLSTCPVKRA